MGLSASQARFLELTARKSNVEYEAQQVNFQRLQLASNLTDASNEYQDAMSNRALKYKFNNGSETISVDLTYTNYKNYMNQQLEGITTAQDKLYLVSSSGKKIVVASAEERNAMIEAYTIYTPIEEGSENLVGSSEENDIAGQETVIRQDEEGNEQTYLVSRKFVESDFLIVDNLDDTKAFQQAIQDGTYYFAKYSYDENSSEFKFKTEPWETIGANAITEDYDVSDDDIAQAKYDVIQKEIQKKDKKLEMELDRLETERNAIQTEMDSVTKVIEDNIEQTFKIFG